VELDRRRKPLNTLYGHRHARHAYYWRYPIHEVLMPLPNVVEKVVWTEDLHIHHLADNRKPRAQYLPMLELAAREEPGDARLAHYYGRELMYHRRWAETIAELERHLRLPGATWAAERCASMRYLARCCAELERFAEAQAWLQRACAETPDTREPWIELARHCMKQRDWLGGVWAAQRALAITVPPKGVMYDSAPRAGAACRQRLCVLCGLTICRVNGSPRRWSWRPTIRASATASSSFRRSAAEDRRVPPAFQAERSTVDDDVLADGDHVWC
jgi:hypothetical protein